MHVPTLARHFVPACLPALLLLPLGKVLQKQATRTLPRLVLQPAVLQQ
jgi:hypothetical protein